MNKINMVLINHYIIKLWVKEAYFGYNELAN